MSNELEDRLRAYGSTIDTATAADLAAPVADVGPGSARHSAHDARRVLAMLAVLAVAGVAVVAVATIGGHARAHTKIRASSSTVFPNTTSAAPTTTPAACDTADADEVTCSRGVLTLTPDQRAQCTPTCAEEGPTLTPEQAAQFATWRSEYDPAEVAYVTRGDPGADDASVVETMVYRVACRDTYAALQAAEQATPADRKTVVDAIMQPAIAVIEQRNWPPGSAAPQIFQRFADLLDNGDIATVSAQVKVGPGSGDCQDALSHRW